MSTVIFDMLDPDENEEVRRLFGGGEPPLDDIPPLDPAHLRDVLKLFRGVHGMLLVDVHWSRHSHARPADDLDEIAYRAEYRLSLVFRSDATGETREVFLEFDDSDGPSREVMRIGGQ